MTPDPTVLEQPTGSSRSNTWRWFICVILLMGTVVNYMDRLTANTLAKEIKHEFVLNNEQYGNLELGFGLAFAAGSLLFGWMVDRFGVYWLYPLVLVGWSAMGFLTGLSETYGQLLVLRILLGLFEAGHFPCGLKTIQVLMSPRDRALGNSLLQSGTALGAILAPQAIRLMLTDDPSSWRLPFQVIGAGGTVWVVFWLLSIRPRDLKGSWKTRGSTAAALDARRSFWEVACSYRFLALAIMVVCINLNWHLFRVWLPLFLQDARGYARDDMLNFSTFYYIAADLGAIAAGFLSGWLARGKLSVYGARMTVYAGCCGLTTLTTAAAFLPKGPLLLGALLVVASGALGSYAAYYSLTQDLSEAHQGKISGALSTVTWVVSAGFHPLFGRYLDRTKDYNGAIAIIGWFPAIALVATLWLWNKGRPGVDERGMRLGNEGED